MKKLITVILIVCLVAAAAVGFAERPQSGLSADFPQQGPMNEIGDIDLNVPAGADPDVLVTEGEYVSPGSEDGLPPESGETEPEKPDSAAGRLDYETLYRSHQPEEAVLRIGDREERWGDYFYLLFTQCGQIENYFDSLSAYYGMDYGWEDPVEDGDDETFAEMAVASSLNLMADLNALERFAEEEGVTVSEEMRELMENQKQEDLLSAIGEEGTEEDFFRYLEGIYLSPEMYDRLVMQNFLYQECFSSLYGENAEKLSDEVAMNWLESNNYVSAAHILLQNTDPQTGEVYEEAVLAEKKARLETAVKELRAIDDEQARKEAFLQKMTEISEDSGAAYYPEGYTYAPGTMVAEFEEAAAALEEYAVSDVVETAYGYHSLMRLPLSADAVVEFSNSTGEPRTARMLAANQEYSERLTETAAALNAEWIADGGEPVLTDYLR